METVLVVGTGRMAYGIIASCATAGYNVRVLGHRETSLETCAQKTLAALQSYADNDIIEASHIPDIMGRVIHTLDPAKAAKNTDIVIETIPEVLEDKKKTFASLDAYLPVHALLATNTSSLLPSEVCSELSENRRKNFVGMHFFFPAHLMRLVELASGQETSPETLERARQFLVNIWKKPALVQEKRGYLVNPIQCALWKVAIELLEIASPEDIDMAIEQTLGRRLGITGPLKSADMTGHKTVLAIGKNLHGDNCTDDGAFAHVQKLVEAGHFGLETGQGLLRWSDKMRAEVPAAREAELYRCFKIDLAEDGVTLTGLASRPVVRQRSLSSLVEMATAE
jgi:3-hydroxybutyryl-CoA dehydrogenase